MARLGGADVPSTPLEAIERARRRDAGAAEGAGVRAAAAGRDAAPRRAGAGGAARHVSATSTRRRRRRAKRSSSTTSVPIETRDKMIEAMRKVTLDHVRELSELRASQETGLGRVEDKIKKNTLVATKTPGAEILRPIAYSGDYGLMITERAPYGVIGAITPTTNPTETIVCNAIGMVAGGNAVVFNTHPSAWRICAWIVHLLNEAIVGAGGPANLVVLGRGADHRERAGADEASAGAHPGRHRRAGRRQRGDELGQARHRRRPRQSARGRRRDREPRRRGARHHRRRLDRQQHHLHRRKRGPRRRQRRRSLEGAAGQRGLLPA